MQKTILCYGDSNTWGYVPQSSGQATQRFARNVRWPGLLQKLLGDNFYVVEEGLNSRTTNINYQIPPDRNGKTYLPSCLYSHAPIDLVIVALGGNDLKKYFNRAIDEIQNGLKDLIEIIQSSNYGSDLKSSPKILVLTVTPPLPIAETFVDENGIRFFEGARKKAEELIPAYARLANEKNCYFLDISQKIIPSEIDGLHLDAEGHRKMALIVHDKLKEIYEI